MKLVTEAQPTTKYGKFYFSKWLPNDSKAFWELFRDKIQSVLKGARYNILKTKK